MDDLLSADKWKSGQQSVIDPGSQWAEIIIIIIIINNNYGCC